MVLAGAMLSALALATEPPQGRVQGELLTTQAAFGGAAGAMLSRRQCPPYYSCDGPFGGSDLRDTTIGGLMGVTVGLGVGQLVYMGGANLAQARALWLGEAMGVVYGSALGWALMEPEDVQIPAGQLALPVGAGALVLGGVGALVGRSADPRRLRFVEAGLVWGAVLSAEAVQAQAAHRTMERQLPAVLATGSTVGLVAGWLVSDWTELDTNVLLGVYVGGAVGLLVGLPMTEEIPEGSARLGTVPMFTTALGLVGGGAFATLLHGRRAHPSASLWAMPADGGVVAHMSVALGRR